MAAHPERRYSIREVSELCNVPQYVLRQWEAKFSQLKPKRNRANRRYYHAADIEVVKRIKTLLKHERFTRDGARVRLAQELHGEGRPRTRQEIVDTLDAIQAEIRAMLDTLDSLRNPS